MLLKGTGRNSVRQAIPISIRPSVMTTTTTGSNNQHHQHHHHVTSSNGSTSVISNKRQPTHSSSLSSLSSSTSSNLSSNKQPTTTTTTTTTTTMIVQQQQHQPLITTTTRSSSIKPHHRMTAAPSQQQQQSIIQDIDTTKYEEIPAKEPDLSRLPEKSALKKPNAVKRRVIPVLRENQRPSPRPSPKLQPELLVTPSSNDVEDDDDEHSSSDEENHEPNKRFANVKRNDSLARFLKDRPLPNELYEKNILVKPLDERKNERETIETKLERKLSLRPRPEELEARNILRAQTAAELIAEKEEKKRVLLRKLSFRPSIQGKIRSSSRTNDLY